MDQKKIIAFVVYPDMTALDLIGPLQILKSLERFGRYEVVTVGERVEPVDTDVGLRMVPERAFADVPRPHVLVVPGGLFGPIKAILNGALMGWIGSAAETAEVVASVCTGSVILAAAGLLEGRRATTHWTFLDALGRLGARPVRERWVEDGKFITAAGVSAGIDMGLALVARLADEATARQIQTLNEYDPKPPFGGIDWRAVDASGLGSALLDSVVPEIRRILAPRPDLAARMFP